MLLMDFPQEFPSLDDFCSDYMCAPDGGLPVVITHGLADWPAMHRWKVGGWVSPGRGGIFVVGAAVGCSVGATVGAVVMGEAEVGLIDGAWVSERPERPCMSQQDLLRRPRPV